MHLYVGDCLKRKTSTIRLPKLRFPRRWFIPFLTTKMDGEGCVFNNDKKYSRNSTSLILSIREAELLITNRRAVFLTVYQ